MNRRICYLVLATPRSGSTLLGQGLQATGLAGDPKEFFGHKMAFWMERWGTTTLPAYAARLIATRSTSNGVFGAKLLYGQLRHLERLARQEDEIAALAFPRALGTLFPNLHLIWATRRDKIRQAVSWFKARQTGVWGQEAGREAVKLGRAWRLGEEPLQPGELDFDYDDIAALLRRAEDEDEAIGRFIAESGLPSFPVVYEEFGPRYEDTLVALLRWLGLEPPPDLALSAPRTMKLADGLTEEWVARVRERQGAAPELR
jgi:LPS sulfotransferase NodH